MLHHIALTVHKYFKEQTQKFTTHVHIAHSPLGSHYVSDNMWQEPQCDLTMSRRQECPCTTRFSCSVGRKTCCTTRRVHDLVHNKSKCMANYRQIFWQSSFPIITQFRYSQMTLCFCLAIIFFFKSLLKTQVDHKYPQTLHDLVT